MMKFFLFLFLVSCGGETFLVKTPADYQVTMFAVKTLSSMKPNHFLRREYAHNKKLTESSINALAQEFETQNFQFLVPGDKDIVVNKGEEVKVSARMYIPDLGDYVQVVRNGQSYLVKDEPPRVLFSHEEYALTINDNQKDFYNHTSDDDRNLKIQLFCQKYPQYQKYERYALDKKITIGMPENLLLLSWGPPNEVKEEAMAGVTKRTYTYSKSKPKYKIFLQNGMIESWITE